jgi:short-subunit dehydrogenase
MPAIHRHVLFAWSRTMADPSSLAVVTGAARGFGYEIAEHCAADGLDLVIADEGPEIADAARRLRSHGTGVTPVDADLSATAGVDALLQATGGRPIAALIANAGRGLGQAFLDHDFEAARRVLDTNITGTVYLVHRIAARMKQQGFGRILITGSIAGYTPDSFQAVYSGTKAFLDSFAAALREELKDSGVSVTSLMPGIGPGEAEDRIQAASASGAAKAGARPRLARAGFDAMMGGYADILTGWKDEGQVAASRLSSPVMGAPAGRK